MNIKNFYLLILLSLLFGLNACIDPYNDANFGQSNKILVVQGLITNDLKNPDTLRIQYSTYVSGGVVITRPIAGTQASIFTVLGGEEIKLIQVGASGGFLPPASFRIKPTEKYSLRFTLPDGQKYESSVQQMLATPPITNIYDIFNLKSAVSEDGKTTSSASEIYVDFQDTPNEKNFYLWRYTHYENQVYCITCERNTLYQVGLQSCVRNQFNYQQNPSYDYQCSGDCYNISRSNKVNVLSDAASDGRLVKGRLVAQIPYHTASGCLVVVQQMSISSEIYSFNKTLEAQTQTTGGLADTPPAGIVGNISNLTNSGEPVVGYFGLADIRTTRYWLDRKNASGEYSYLIGHRPLEEPQLPPTRPPYARCLPSLTRTSIKPEGWKN